MGSFLSQRSEIPSGASSATDTNGAPLAPGTVIAMTRLAMVSDSEAWLEGIRVDPRVRGMDVATDLQVAELHWIVAHRARVVRYITSELNAGSLRLGARHGLVEIGRWRSRAGQEDDDESPDHEHVTGAVLAPLARATTSDWRWLSADPTFLAAHGLYEYRGWAFQELTEARFDRHVERGEAFAASGRGSGSKAVLILNGGALSGGHVQVAFLAGDAEAALELLAPLGYPQVRLPDPLPTTLAGIEPALEMAGLKPWSHAVVIVERPMDAEHPVPTVDPARLVLEEVPRAIARPPALE